MNAPSTMMMAILADRRHVAPSPNRALYRGLTLNNMPFSLSKNTCKILLVRKKYLDVPHGPMCSELLDVTTDLQLGPYATAIVK
jgi:hypothetical protein